MNVKLSPNYRLRLELYLSVINTISIVKLSITQYNVKQSPFKYSTFSKGCWKSWMLNYCIANRLPSLKATVMYFMLYGQNNQELKSS